MDTAPDSFTARMTGWLFLPAMALGIGSAVVTAASTEHSALIVFVLVVAAAGSFVAERLCPYEVEWNTSQGDRWRDVAHAVVNESSTAAGVALIAVASSAWPGLGSWPRSLPFGVEVFIAVVVLDAGITLVHWRSHSWNWLWRFHAVHHSVRRLYGLNGLVKHPVHQAVETGAGMLPLLLLDIPSDVAAALAGLVVVQLLLQHSNCDYRAGVVGRWIALNRGHRLHHVDRVPDGNVNFGLFLLVWDRLLGTYRDPRQWRVMAGEVGIAGRRTYPAEYAAQLVEPFRRRPVGSTTGMGICDSEIQRQPKDNDEHERDQQSTR